MKSKNSLGLFSVCVVHMCEIVKEQVCLINNKSNVWGCCLSDRSSLCIACNAKASIFEEGQVEGAQDNVPGWSHYRSEHDIYHVHTSGSWVENWMWKRKRMKAESHQEATSDLQKRQKSLGQQL